CFFFSSRRRHTISKRDCSSDVCSSDLGAASPGKIDIRENSFHRTERHFSPTKNSFSLISHRCASAGGSRIHRLRAVKSLAEQARSEERRVGKEGGCRWSAAEEPTRRYI